MLECLEEEGYVIKEHYTRKEGFAPKLESMKIFENESKKTGWDIHGATWGSIKEKVEVYKKVYNETEKELSFVAPDESYSYTIFYRYKH